MRNRSLIVLALVAALLGAAAAPAVAATTVAQIQRALSDHGWYVEPGTPGAPTRAQLAALHQTHPDLAIVSLRTPPRGTKPGPRLAHFVLQGQGSGTVIVTVGARTYAASSTLKPAAVRRALRAAGAGTAAQRVDRFAGALSGSSVGGFPWTWLVVGLALAGGVLVALRLRARSAAARKRRRRRGGSVATAQTFHQERLDSLSTRHGTLTDAVADLPASSEASEHFLAAGGTLAALRRTLDQVVSPRELRTFAAELDQAEWHLECIESALAGAQQPERPITDRPGLCFFSYEHGLAREAIDVIRPDGTAARIRVCPANAEALRRGEPPLVSMVHVGGRRVPWPAAPTWYGAPGWSTDDLPGLEFDGREIWGREVPRNDSYEPDAGAAGDEPTVAAELDEPHGSADPWTQSPAPTADAVSAPDEAAPTTAGLPAADTVPAPPAPEAAAPTAEAARLDEEPPAAPAAASPVPPTAGVTAEQDTVVQPPAPTAASEAGQTEIFPRSGFEELDAPPPPALGGARGEAKRDREHHEHEAERTAAFDPFAEGDLDLEAGPADGAGD